MDYSLIDEKNVQNLACVVTGYFEDGLESSLGALQNAGDYLWTAPNKLSIHCGKAAAPDELNKIIQNIASALKQQKIEEAAIKLPQFDGITPDQQLEHMLIAFDEASYKVPNFKSTDADEPRLTLIQFALTGTNQSALDNALALTAGIHWTKYLANLPGNLGTPSHIAEEVQRFSKEHKSTVKINILDREDMQNLKMGAFLAIADGSDEPPKLIEIQYKGAEDKKAAPIVLIGKGVTFDSGGISLKPSAGMHEMKYDMAGAASVCGAIKTAALMQLPINIVGLLACTENMPSDKAVKPGDVVTSMLGKTIEMTNTDAEGRMVLADTLTYAERFNPEFVIDIATLTGAMVVALGDFASGLMTPDDELAKLIEDAGKTSKDYAWRMPLDKSYQKALESPIADMINCSTGRGAGSLTAASFLSNFASNFRWAHLDIAGTAWVSGNNNHATGRPVPLLVQLLREAAHAG